MVIWDADGDGRMDDLNRDGQIDQTDAQVFADHLTAVQQRMGKFGGIGTGPTPKIPGLVETPYVGIDMRGFAIKW